jgi:hypothetical protein
MQEIINVFKSFWDIITNSNGEYTLADLSILQVIIVALFIYGVFKILKSMFKHTDMALKST